MRQSGTGKPVPYSGTTDQTDGTGKPVPYNGTTDKTDGTGKPVPYNGTRDQTVGEGLAPPVFFFLSICCYRSSICFHVPWKLDISSLCADSM